MHHTKEKIRILIADDHPIVRQGLRQTIENEDDLVIVGEAGTGIETVSLSRSLCPEIIILDIDIPEMDGFQVAGALGEEQIESKIIFLTVHREESFLKKALSLGAAGFVLKDSTVTDIITAIRAVSKDQSFVSPAMTKYLTKTRSSPATKNFDTLTAAERRVLRLIAQYKTTKEIAEELFISPRTVESHRASITQKLNLRGSHSLMRYALQHLPEIDRY